jgi:hypothetical protein
MAERYGAEMTVPDWHNRLVCGQCGSRQVDYVWHRREALSRSRFTKKRYFLAVQKKSRGG